MCEIKFYVTLHRKIFDNESYAHAKLKKPLKLVWATFWKPIWVKIESLCLIISRIHSITPCVKISSWNINRNACYAYAKNLAKLFWFWEFLCIHFMHNSTFFEIHKYKNQCVLLRSKFCEVLTHFVHVILEIFSMFYF